MKIIFLGTNGWYTNENGNTPSILIDTKDYYIVLDAGNGIYKLDSYIAENKPIHLFISHLHIDHIEGLHILPIFHFKNNMTIFVQKGQTDLLKIFVNVPYSHAFKNLKFQVDFKELNEENTLPYSLSTKLLNHVIPCIGMRFEIEEKIISYCTDTGVCDNALLLGNNVDVFIHECSNFKNYDNSWGHVTPEIAGEIAKKTRPKKFIATHFSPPEYPTLNHRKDAEKRIQNIYPLSQVAYDDLVIEI